MQYIAILVITNLMFNTHYHQGLLVIVVCCQTWHIYRRSQTMRNTLGTRLDWRDTIVRVPRMTAAVLNRQLQVKYRVHKGVVLHTRHVSPSFLQLHQHDTFVQLARALIHAPERF